MGIGGVHSGGPHYSSLPAFTFVHTAVRCVWPINTCVPYMLSNTTVILVAVLFYHGYVFRRLIESSSGYSGGLHCYYQSIYIFSITITL
jgi:hypothetical protein